MGRRTLYMRAWEKLTYHARVAERMCATRGCDAPPRKGRRYCRACAKENQARWKRWWWKRHSKAAREKREEVA